MRGSDSLPSCFWCERVPTSTRGLKKLVVGAIMTAHKPDHYASKTKLDAKTKLSRVQVGFAILRCNRSVNPNRHYYGPLYLTQVVQKDAHASLKHHYARRLRGNSYQASPAQPVTPTLHEAGAQRRALPLGEEPIRAIKAAIDVSCLLYFNAPVCEMCSALQHLAWGPTC